MDVEIVTVNPSNNNVIIRQVSGLSWKNYGNLYFWAHYIPGRTSSLDFVIGTSIASTDITDFTSNLASFINLSSSSQCTAISLTGGST